MAVYIIVGLVVLFGLVLAYRTFGGASAAAIDVPATLRTVLATARGAARDVDEQAGAAPLLGARGPGAANHPAKAVRRRLSGLAQQLDGIDSSSLDERDSGAHALLAVAVDELVWAAGMCADDTFSASEGMRNAVATLADHATSCLDGAAAILEASAAEEVERAP